MKTFIFLSLFITFNSRLALADTPTLVLKSGQSTIICESDDHQSESPFTHWSGMNLLNGDLLKNPIISTTDQLFGQSQSVQINFPFSVSAPTVTVLPKSTQGGLFSNEDKYTYCVTVTKQ